MEQLPQQVFTNQISFRLIPSKYPPVSLFDDVASHDQFEVLFAIQALTNPRIRQEMGSLNHVAPSDRPYGIRGCSYALGPFVHINPSGSRFSRGEFGIYYAAADIPTAIAETRYHQQRYFSSVEGLKYDRLSMRCLKTQFSASLCDLRSPEFVKRGWFHLTDYSAAQRLGARLKAQHHQGVVYNSVRNSGAACFGLFTPKIISDVIQTSHYEYIWDGNEISVALETQMLTDPAQPTS